MGVRFYVWVWFILVRFYVMFWWCKRGIWRFFRYFMYGRVNGCGWRVWKGVVRGWRICENFSNFMF